MRRDEEHLRPELLSAHLDGELAAADLPALERHLGRCAGCRERLEDLRVLARAAADEGTPPVPEGLAARVVQRLDEEPATATPAAGRKRHRPPWLWRGGPLAAAASLLGAAILWRLWLAGPAPVAPLKTLAPSPPEVQENLPRPEPSMPSSEPRLALPPAGVKNPSVKKKERAKKGDVADLEEGEAARQEAPSRDRVLGFASQEAAAPTASPAPEDKVLADEDAAAADAPAAKDAARAMAPAQLQESRPMEATVMREEDSRAGAFLQEESDGIRVTLTREGSLNIQGDGYDCRLDLDMEDEALWSQARAAASRGRLGRMMVTRYRSELEEQCGSLPEPLAALPQN